MDNLEVNAVVSDISKELLKYSSALLFFVAVLLMSVIVDCHQVILSIFERRKQASSKSSGKKQLSLDSSKSKKKIKRSNSSSKLKSIKDKRRKKSLQALPTTNGCDKSEHYLRSVPPESDRCKLGVSKTRSDQMPAVHYNSLPTDGVPPMNLAHLKLPVPAIVQQREKKQASENDEAMKQLTNRRLTTKETEERDERSEKVIKKVHA
uniref:Uncharacterized protein n=1 Tax=Panagrolaimus sp. ES5 TaxID=591445 RepID=A0AC34FJZ4_9BILA